MAYLKCCLRRSLGSMCKEAWFTACEHLTILNYIVSRPIFARTNKHLNPQDDRLATQSGVKALGGPGGSQGPRGLNGLNVPLSITYCNVLAGHTQ